MDLSFAEQETICPAIAEYARELQRLVSASDS